MQAPVPFPQSSFPQQESLSNWYVLIFLRLIIQQVPNNVTENAAVLPRLTAFSCGYTVLSANRRTQPS